MIYTGLGRVSEIADVKANGGADVAEVYGGINYQNPIFYSNKTLTGTSPLTFNGLGQPLKDYHIFGETVDVQGVGEYDYVSGKYYVPISGDTAELCDIHDIDRGTLRCGIAALGYHVDASYLVNVSTKTSTPNVILIPVKSATTYRAKFKTNNAAFGNDKFVRVAFINELAEGAGAYDIYTWQRGGNDDKLRNNKEYFVTMVNTNHRYLVVQSNLSPFGLFDYFSIREVLSVIDIGSDPLYRVGDDADEIDFANQQIIRRIDPSTMQPYATPITSTITVPQLTAAFGDNTLSVDTTVKPSAVSITGNVKPTGYGQLLDVNDVDIQDSTGTPIFIQG